MSPEVVKVFLVFKAGRAKPEAPMGWLMVIPSKVTIVVPDKVEVRPTNLHP